MSSSSSSSNGSLLLARGFAFGAVAALSAVWLVTTRLQQQQRKRRTTATAALTAARRRRTTTSSDGDSGETAAVAATPESESNGNNNGETVEIIVDAPDLDLRLLRKAEAVIRGRCGSVVAVVERCVNDHNYSAILRTAEALGIQTVYIIDPPSDDEAAEATGGASPNGDEEEGLLATNGINGINNKQGQHYGKDGPDDPLLKSQHKLFAQNATGWLTLREFETAQDCMESLREDNYEVWATDLSQEAVPLTVDGLLSAQQQQQRNDDNDDDSASLIPNRLAVVFGTEAVGVSQYFLDRSDLRVYLPLRGFADSLNLSVAAALVLHQLLLLDPSLVGNLSPQEKRGLRELWYPKLARQRLLTHKQKKRRRKLMQGLETCSALEIKRSEEGMVALTKEQQAKLEKVGKMEEELRRLEDSVGWHDAAEAVKPYVDDPPAPLSDLRRADLHRVTYVGKSTKARHADHWKDLVGVNNLSGFEYRTVEKQTAGWFRRLIQSGSSTASSSTATVTAGDDEGGP